MFASKFALALFTVATSAEYQGGYDGNYGHNNYGNYGNNGNYGNYGGYHHHQAPKVDPFQKPEEPAAEVDKSTWFNQYQQFTNPWRQYVPSYNPHPVMAICAMTPGNVQLAQLSNQATMVKAEFEDLGMEKGYKLRIQEFGNIGEECKATGEEFNPLKEMKYGVQNPYQDKTRGRINDFASDDMGVGKVWQKVLLQNLSGKESLIGKSLMLLEVVGDDMPDMIIDCCVIGEDALPDHVKAGHKKYQPTYRHLHQHQPVANHQRYQPYQSAPTTSYVVDYGYKGNGSAGNTKGANHNLALTKKQLQKLKNNFGGQYQTYHAPDIGQYPTYGTVNPGNGGKPYSVEIQYRNHNQNNNDATNADGKTMGADNGKGV